MVSASDQDDNGNGSMANFGSDETAGDFYSEYECVEELGRGLSSGRAINNLWLLILGNVKQVGSQYFFQALGLWKMIFKHVNIYLDYGVHERLLTFVDHVLSFNHGGSPLSGASMHPPGLRSRVRREDHGRRRPRITNGGNSPRRGRAIAARTGIWDSLSSSALMFFDLRNSLHEPTGRHIPSVVGKSH